MYLKTNYPLEYFTVCFNEYADNLNTTSELTGELSSFNITLKEPVFREARGQYTFNKDERTIIKGIASVKSINNDDAENLYRMRDMHFESFVDFLYVAKENKIRMDKLENLIKINFFKEFGQNKKLLKIWKIFREYGEKSQFKKASMPDFVVDLDMTKYAEESEKLWKKINMRLLLSDVFKRIPNEGMTIREQIATDNELTGATLLRIDSDKPLYYVADLKTKFTPVGTFYNLKTGETTVAKIQKYKYQARPFKVGDILYVSGFEEKPKWLKTDNGFEQSKTEKELHVSSFTIGGDKTC